MKPGRAPRAEALAGPGPGPGGGGRRGDRGPVDRLDLVLVQRAAAGARRHRQRHVGRIVSLVLHRAVDRLRAGGRRVGRSHQHQHAPRSTAPSRSTSISDSGATVATPVSVPAGSQVVEATPTTAGSWVSQAVIMTGGGVAVTQFVHGPSGWSQAPCRSDTSRQWYFPSGTTAGSDDMYMALFNPTSTPDVVDLTFVTPTAVVHPISFQGIVLQPGQTQVEDVGAYVQDQSSVATTVTTRTGRLVAGETQVFGGGLSGLALVPGAPRAEPHWSIPQSQEVVGGASSIDIFNPGQTAETVTVHARLASGPLPAFHDRRPAQRQLEPGHQQPDPRTSRAATGVAGNYRHHHRRHRWRRGGGRARRGRTERVAHPTGGAVRTPWTPPAPRRRRGSGWSRRRAPPRTGPGGCGADRAGPDQPDRERGDLHRFRHDLGGTPRP